MSRPHDVRRAGDHGAGASWLRVSTADGPMRVYRAAPRAGRRPSGAVLVLQEAFGVNKHIQDVARRVAAEGYLAMAPDLFHRTGIGVLDYADHPAAMEQIAALGPGQIGPDVAAVLAHLGDGEGISVGQTSVMGFCFGGRAAFTAATMLPGIASTVSFYGPGVASGPHAVLDRVAGITGSVLLLVGAEDPTLPPSDLAAIQEACAEAGVDLRLEVFPGAGHAFHCDARPAAYREEAALQAWRDAMAFLADTMPAGPAVGR